MLSIQELLKNEENLKRSKQVLASLRAAMSDSRWAAENKLSVEIQVLLAAYLFLCLEKSDDPLAVSYEEIRHGKLTIPPDLLALFLEAVPEEKWLELKNRFLGYSPEIWVTLIFLPIEETPSTAISTPDSLVKLAKKLLCCSSRDKVADIGCGIGSFLLSAAMENPEAQYYGFDLARDYTIIARIRAEVMGVNIQIVIQDAFSLAENEERKFDKIFANYPLGARLTKTEPENLFLETIKSQCPEIEKSTSADWIYNALLVQLLNEGGKAVGIMTNGGTWNGNDESVRRYFIENGFVECVISMPSKLFLSTSIPTSLIVLSHKNRSVRLVDATALYQKGRRQNEFGEEDIRKILYAVGTDCEYSREVSVEELRENKYVLSLSRYGSTEDGNGVPLGEIASISRGAPYTARQLDEMTSNSQTNFQYLMLSNIQDGIIERDLPYLTSIAPKHEKYCLENGNLILSKNGIPYKAAVVSLQNGQRILASGNLYILRLDRGRVNPYYLKAYFESERGADALKRISVGASIPNISLEQLKNLCIPLPDMETQNSLATLYQAAQDKVITLRQELNEAVEKLRHIFDL